MKSTITSFLISVLVLFLTGSCAEKQGQMSEIKDTLKANSQTEITITKLELPERFLNILREEMNQLNGGMGALFSYMVRGQGQEAAAIAMNIHNSFILKQELSKEELSQLVSLLPEQFVNLDRGFHQLAEEISVTLNNGELKKSAQIYGQMVDACVNCHSQFATERFPGFQKIVKINEVEE